MGIVLDRPGILPVSFFQSDFTREPFISDSFSNTLQFTQQASTSVPFEFSPTTGLFLVGGIFGLKRYVKHRQANKLAGK